MDFGRLDIYLGGKKWTEEIVEKLGNLDMGGESNACRKFIVSVRVDKLGLEIFLKYSF